MSRAGTTTAATMMVGPSRPAVAWPFAAALLETKAARRSPNQPPWVRPSEKSPLGLSTVHGGRLSTACAGLIPTSGGVDPNPTDGSEPLSQTWSDTRPYREEGHQHDIATI